MFRLSTIRVLAMSIAGVLFAGGTASAGWICIKNESTDAVVLQEIPDRPTSKLGKVVRLLPGEVYREYQPHAGEKLIQLFDLKNTSRPLFFGRLTWPKGDVALKIRNGETAVKLVPVVPADKSEPPVVTASAKAMP